ncbi:MAG: ABC transporter substrate-binding protein [Pseudomonadota bacterium]|nr:ABC transporter substrate-binding protein [Pseudomonadota bacterium]
MRLTILKALALLLLPVMASLPARAEPPTPIEPPYFQPQISNGELPPVAERVPTEPAVADFAAEGKSVGRYGGTLRLLLGNQKDTRMITVYGYARLMRYTPTFKLEPDILKKLDVEEGRIFTLYLRKGHKWSDGKPFTAEDFRYYWDDVAQNKELSPGGPPKEMRVGKELAKFEVIDEHTIRYSWSKPNPQFPHWLAGALPAAIFRPAHYMKQYHANYGDKAEIEELVKAEGRRNWAELHFSRDRPFRADNPEYPTLEPWITVTQPPAQRYVYQRNPFYYRVDPEGRQLPYIDEVVVTLGSEDMVPARTGSGEADLQARYLRFEHYTFLKKAEKRTNTSVYLWRTLKTSHKALYPNMNAADPAWRMLMRDVRFRRALSLGINRHEINMVIYYGLANEGNDTVFPDSELFKPEYRDLWAQYDLVQANNLLDEIGLSKRDDDGIRLLPDGRPMHIIVDLAGESSEESDILELVRDSWAELGIKMFPRPSQREVFRNRVASGQAIMTIWAGLGNGMSTAGMSPDSFVPYQKLQYQWPQWGTWVQTNGKKGEEPDQPEAKELIKLYKAWEKATDDETRTKIWHKILKINAEQVYTIGTVNATLQPVTASNDLQNVPEKGVYNWDPGAYFGIYKPDTFWFRNAPQSASVQGAIQ